MSPRPSSERGTTLVELLVTIMIGIIVIGTVIAVVRVADRGSGRVAARVDANTRARPVMQRIMDELHSSCVSRGVAPVIAGSTGTSITFLHQTGSAATLTPVRRVITLSGGNLTERVLVGSGSSWTQSGATRTLLTDVSPATVNGASVPLFQYFAYNGTQLSTTPLSVPLTADGALRTVQVNVAFQVAPVNNPTGEDATSTSLVDSAVLRFAPAGETTTPENLPCV